MNDLVACNYLINSGSQSMTPRFIKYVKHEPKCINANRPLA